MTSLDNDRTDAKVLRMLLSVLPFAFTPAILLAVWLGSGSPHASASATSLVLGAAGALGAVHSAIAVARLVMGRRRGGEE